MSATMTKQVSLTPAQRYQVELLAQASADWQHDHICERMNKRTAHVLWRRGLIDCDAVTWRWSLTDAGRDAAREGSVNVVDRGTFYEPGTMFGPHVDCDHAECAQTRREAAKTCERCGDPIGYGRDWVSVDGRFYHDDCMNGDDR